MPAFNLKVGESMADGTVIIDTELDNSGLKDGLNKMNSLATKGLKGITIAVSGATTAIGGLTLAATKVGMGFESSMSQVAATMGITADEINSGSEAFELLKKAAKDAGSTTKFSASQSAEALNYLALAGYSAEKSVTALPTVLNLAAAGGLDLAYASDLVTDSMSALGLEMTELESFTDKLAKTSQKSNTSVAQLGEAILTVGGTAKVLAGGTTELNTALGILADNGVKGAEGGTALRNIILSLTAPTNTAAKKMKELGLEVLDAEGNMRLLNDIFNDLNDILSDMTQGKQTQVLNEIFNKTDLKSVNALLANSGERFDELSGYIDNASGAAADMAETMENNLNGKLTVIGSSLEGVGIQVYEKLEEPLKKAADTAIESLGNLSENLANGKLSSSVDAIAEGFGKLIENLAEGVETWLPKILDAFAWLLDNSNTIATGIVAIAAGMAAMNVANMIMGVVKAFQAFKLANEGATVAQWLLNAAMYANPIGIIVGLVVGLVAAIIYLWNTNETFREAIINCWNAILNAGKAVWEWLVQFFTEDIPNAFNSIKEWFANLPEWFNELWSKVTAKFKEWGATITNFFTETIPQWIENIGEWFSELPYKIGYAIGEVLGTIIKWGMDTWNYLVENVPLWINGIVDWFSKLPGRIWEWLVAVYNKTVKWGADMAKRAKESAQEFINNIIEWFCKLPTRIKEWCTNTITEAKKFVVDLGDKAKEAGKELIDNIVNTVQNLPLQMMEIGKNIVEGVWNGITSMGCWLVDSVKGFFGGIVDGVKKTLGIHSPSRVFRDEVGKYMAQGVGVGFESESENIKKDMQSSVEGITAKMKATVVAEQSRSVPAVVSKENNTTANDNKAFNRGNARQKVMIEVPVVVDGREIARATAPYTDEFEKYQEGR